MTLRRSLLAAPLLAGACSLLPDRPYLETRRFPLAPVREGPPRRFRPRRALLLRTLGAGAGLDQKGLITVKPDGTESVDFYAEWVAPPAEAAESALRRWLASCGLFTAVLAPGTRASPDLSLEGDLNRLAAFQAEGVARAELSFVLLDERASPTRVAGQLVSRGSAALATGTQAPTAEAAADAMRQALANAFASLEEALVRYA